MKTRISNFPEHGHNVNLFLKIFQINEVILPKKLIVIFDAVHVNNN